MVVPLRWWAGRATLPTVGQHALQRRAQLGVCEAVAGVRQHAVRPPAGWSSGATPPVPIRRAPWGRTSGMMNVGRRSTEPSVEANSALVTGLGATRLTGPDTASLSRQCRLAPTSSVKRDPAHPLGARQHLAAEPELEERQLLGQRAALGGLHDAGAQRDGADVGLGRHAGRLPPIPRTPWRGSRCPAATPRPTVGRRCRRSTRWPTPTAAPWAVSSSPAMVPAISEVPLVRLVRIARCCSAVHRLAAMGSPARWMTASMPSSAAASMSPSSGDQYGGVRIGGRTVAGSRQRQHRSPRALQRLAERRADESARTGDRNIHAASQPPPPPRCPTDAGSSSTRPRPPQVPSTVVSTKGLIIAAAITGVLIVAAFVTQVVLAVRAGLSRPGRAPLGPPPPRPGNRQVTG